MLEVTVLAMPLQASILLFLVSHFEKNIFDLTKNIVIGVVAFVLHATLSVLVVIKYKDKKKQEKIDQISLTNLFFRYLWLFNL